MNRKLFIVGVLVVLLAIFIVPKRGQNNVDIKKEDYGNFNLKTGAQYLKEKANDISVTNYNDGNISEMYTFNHEATNHTLAQTDYRYIGDSPNNYVYFNCEDENDISTCEIWRIIGVFSSYHSSAQNYISDNIKIVRGDLLSDKKEWNTDGNNKWRNSSLNQYFNGRYGDYENSVYYGNLSESAKNMIVSMTYYLTPFEYDETGYHYGNVSDIYIRERTNLNIMQETYDWTGKVGLMYPSDYGYTFSLGVDNICYNDLSICYNDENGHPENSWIYNSNIIEGTNDLSDIWLISSIQSSVSSTVIMNNGRLGGSYVYSLAGSSGLSGVRPTLYLSDTVIITGGNGSYESPYILSSYKNYVTDLYKKITYNGVEYYVIDENDDEDYVTLLKAEPLSYSDMRSHSNNLNIKIKKSENYGMMQYYYADDCYYNSQYDNNLNGCTTDYNQSLIKKVVDSWTSDNVCHEALVSKDGYTSRILSVDDLMGKLGYSPHRIATDAWYALTEDVPDWLYSDKYTQWTMTQAYDNYKNMYFIQKDGYVSDGYRGLHLESFLSSYNTVRPVINVKKSMLNNSCEKSNSNKVCKEVIDVIEYDTYQFGDIINYNDSNYYVIEDSDEDTNYVTLLKDVPLTVDEVLNYGRDNDGKLFVNSFVFYDDDLEKKVSGINNSNIAGVAYYSTEDCSATYTWHSSFYKVDSFVTNGCKIDYDKSDIKKLIDNWSKDFDKDLIEVEGYKSRLITLDELIDVFNYTPRASSSIILYENYNSPEWLKNYSFWTMTPYTDSDNTMLTFQSDGVSFLEVYASNYGVRPIIYLNKCVLENGCVYGKKLECYEIEDILEEKVDGNNDNIIGKIVVIVSNTLKGLPQIVIILSLLSIIVGLIVLGYNYYKSRKERK